MTVPLLGYVQSDGTVGFRNHVLLIPTVTCAAVVCERIAEAVEGCVTIPHQHGCSQIGDDAAKTFDMLHGMGCNPNVAAVLVVSLGCEVVDGVRLTQKIASTGKPVEFLRIQDEGGSQKAIHKGIHLAQLLRQSSVAMTRQGLGWDAVRLAVKWGDGLDQFPGDHRVLQALVRELLSRGSAVIVGETEKVQGRLERQTKLNLPNSHDASVAVKPWIDVCEPQAVPNRLIASIAKPSPYPDIFAGGLTSVMDYAQVVPNQPGLHVVKTPCSDVECLSAFAASGANVCLFFSGGPSPIGNPVIPIIKIGTTNASQIWRDHLDIILPASLDESDPTEHALGILYTVAKMASGEWTAAEWLGHQEFSIHRFGLSL